MNRRNFVATMAMAGLATLPVIGKEQPVSEVPDQLDIQTPECVLAYIIKGYRDMAQDYRLSKITYYGKFIDGLEYIPCVTLSHSSFMKKHKVLTQGVLSSTLTFPEEINREIKKRINHTGGYKEITAASLQVQLINPGERGKLIEFAHITFRPMEKYLKECKEGTV